MKFINIILWVQENKLSEKFYKKLGFAVVRSDDEHSIVVFDALRITLVNMRDEDPFTNDSMAGDRGRGMYICITVDDADREYERQKTIGLQPYSKPRDWAWGSREFVLKDPDGYKLVFSGAQKHN